MELDEKYECVSRGEQGCMECGDWSEPVYDANGFGLILCPDCMEKDGYPVEFNDELNEWIVKEDKK